MYTQIRAHIREPQSLLRVDDRAENELCVRSDLLRNGAEK
jgi:hypothetical protein